MRKQLKCLRIGEEFIFNNTRHRILYKDDTVGNVKCMNLVEYSTITYPNELLVEKFKK